MKKRKQTRKSTNKKRKVKQIKNKKSNFFFLFLLLFLLISSLGTIFFLLYKIYFLKSNYNTMDTDVIKFEIGKKYSYSNIYFDPQTANLKKESYYILNRIYRTLEINEGLKVEIIGHTDTPNQDLSERRARAVLNYIASKGIEASRMTSIGMSNTEPIVKNSYNTSKNRRVEFIFRY